MERGSASQHTQNDANPGENREPSGASMQGDPNATAGANAGHRVAEEDESSHAAQSIVNAVFTDRAPRHVVDGVTSGAVEALKGVALGVGCLGASVYAGVKDGTVTGLLGCTAAGVAGLVGMTLYGGACGVKKVLQGAYNTGDALQAAAEGDRIWDEVAGAYVKFDLSTQRQRLPTTDDDIFSQAAMAAVNEDRERRSKQSAGHTTENGASGPSSASGLPPRTSVDFYAVLGVAKTASKAEVRKAYAAKALLLHPDKNRSPDAPEQFRAVCEAYKVLSDDVLRAKYDAGGGDHSGATTTPRSASTGAAGGGAGFCDEAVNPLEELLAGHVFTPWMGRLRYLLYLHPHLRFSSAMMKTYEKRKRIRVACFLADLLDSSDPVQRAQASVQDMMATSKVGRQIVLLIADSLASAARQFSLDPVSREADRFASSTVSGVSNVATVISTAGRAAVKAYQRTVGEEDMYALFLAACTSDIHDTVADAAHLVLIDASVSRPVKQQRSEAMIALATYMSDAAKPPVLTTAPATQSTTTTTTTERGRSSPQGN